VLTRLTIRNYAVAEEIALDLEAGLTVFSGETGAGKSILVDALGLVLGDRADSSIVRAGAERAELTAEFDICDCPDAGAWLSANELEADGECLVTRSIGRDGRSRAWINGRPMTVTAVRELGDMLADIHHQHAHQSLLKPAYQCRMLDDFAGNQELLARLGAAGRAWQQAIEQIESLRGSEGSLQERLDLLQYQCDELRALELDEGSWQALNSEHRRLSNASHLLESVSKALAAVSDDQVSARGLLDQATAGLAGAAALDSDLEPVARLLDEAGISLGEAESEMRHYLDRVEVDPARLADAERRIGDIQDLARKHRIDAQDLSAHLQKLETELDALRGAGESLEQLEARTRELQAAYHELAGELHARRRTAADDLQAKVRDSMRELGMPHAVFEIKIRHAGQAARPSPNGLDSIELLVTTNPGQPPAALSKVASGGELSRISLAIQVIAVSGSGVPTLVFDEVDVGIGGAVAETVGALLRTLGDHRQVMCITHLPQVASQGHAHMRVSKLTTESAAHTRIEPLDAEQRIEEVARMLGGRELTEQSRAHAREMVARSEDDTVSETA